MATATATITCRDRNGAPKPGVTLQYSLLLGPGTDGASYDTSYATLTADANGLISVALVQGATYTFRRGHSLEVPVTVDPLATTLTLPEVLGND